MKQRYAFKLEELTTEQLKNKIEKLCNTAITYFKNKEYNSAITNYTEALDIANYYESKTINNRDKSHYASILYNRARAYEESGKLYLAYKGYNETIKINPNHSKAHQYLDNYYKGINPFPDQYNNKLETINKKSEEVEKLPYKSNIIDAETIKYDSTRLSFIKECLEFMQNEIWSQFSFSNLSSKEQVFLDSFLTLQAINLFKLVGNCIVNLSGKLRGEYGKFLESYGITWVILEHIAKIIDDGAPDQITTIPLNPKTQNAQDIYTRFVNEYSSPNKIADEAIYDILKDDIPKLLKLFTYISINDPSSPAPKIGNLVAIKTLSKLILDTNSLVSLLRISKGIEPKDDHSISDKNLQGCDMIVMNQTFNKDLLENFDNKLYQHAFLRKLQKIGEFITNKNLSTSIKKLDLTTDWEMFVDIRDIITHQEEKSNKYTIKTLFNSKQGLLRNVILEIENGFFLRLLELICKRDQALPIKFNLVNDNEDNAKEFWTILYQLELEKSKLEVKQTDNLRVSLENFTYFISELNNLQVDKSLVTRWSAVLEGSCPIPNKIEYGTMLKPMSELKKTDKEKYNKLKNIADQAIHPESIPKIERIKMHEQEEAERLKQEEEQRKNLDYTELEHIKELRALLVINDVNHQINDIGKLESTIESLENIKLFLEKDIFIQESFDYPNIQDWLDAHIDKEKVYNFFARMITAPELRDAIEYNAGQLLQNLDALKNSKIFNINLLNDEFYEPLRLLRNYIEHGNHIHDAQRYIPNRIPELLDNKSKVIGPAMMKLIFDLLPSLKNLHTYNTIEELCSTVEVYMLEGYFDITITGTDYTSDQDYWL